MRSALIVGMPNIGALKRLCIVCARGSNEYNDDLDGMKYGIADDPLSLFAASYVECEDCSGW